MLGPQLSSDSLLFLQSAQLRVPPSLPIAKSAVVIGTPVDRTKRNSTLASSDGPQGFKSEFQTRRFARAAPEVAEPNSCVAFLPYRIRPPANVHNIPINLYSAAVATMFPHRLATSLSRRAYSAAAPATPPSKPVSPHVRPPRLRGSTTPADGEDQCIQGVWKAVCEGILDGAVYIPGALLGLDEDGEG